MDEVVVEVLIYVLKRLLKYQFIFLKLVVVSIYFLKSFVEVCMTVTF